MLKKSVIISIITLLIAGPLFLSSMIHGASPQDVLSSDWNSYKQTYIDPDGAVRRRDQGNDVVSEGVAYAMLRATWMNDQDTFDKVYNWTEKNMSRLNNSKLNDNLLGWHWSNGFGSVDSDNWGAASDADEDYALSLAFASKKWGTPKIAGLPSYTDKSLAVQKDILRLETGWVGDKVYLQPGTWFQFKAPITVNPSYLSPAMYKIFNQMSPDPRWDKLVQSSYEVLEKSSQTIEGNVGVGLPPDWVQVNDNGTISKAPSFGIDYKYDAFRTDFRVALDYIWFNDSRAKNYLTLSGARNVLLKDFTTRGLITGEYRHDGASMSNYENPGVYGVNIGWFIPENQDVVKQFVQKMENEFNKNGGKFFASPNYYMSNWAAFGYAMGTNNVPNIYNGGSTNIDPSANNAANNEKSTIIDAVSSTVGNIVAPPTPAPVIKPSTLPSAAPSIFKPETPTQSNKSQGGDLKINYPADGQSVDGQFTFKTTNTTPNLQGTWWSVDSGEWVALYKPDPNSNDWQNDINISSWNWSSNNEYTLHAWTKDKDNNQYHTQIIIKKQ
jgi:endoglucanase